MPQSTWYTRLIEEHADVATRYHKLRQFLDSDHASSVDDLSLELLTKQADIMRELKGVLYERIKHESAMLRGA